MMFQKKRGYPNPQVESRAINIPDNIMELLRRTQPFRYTSRQELKKRVFMETAGRKTANPINRHGGAVPNVFFTSDTHFYHERMLSTYGDRPFDCVEEMNDALVEKWNKRVGPKDIIYHLGDFAVASKALAVQTLSRLRGHLHLVFGNHDDSLRTIMNTPNIKKPKWAGDMKMCQVHGQNLFIAHYPMRCWNGYNHGQFDNVWMLHGHCHGDLPHHPEAPSLDVGVDNPLWLDVTGGYAPIEYEELKAMITTLYLGR